MCCRHWHTFVYSFRKATIISSSTNITRQRKSRQMKIKVKSMLINLFYIKGIVYKEFVVESQNSQFCILIRRFTMSEWKLAKTSPRTLATKELAAVSRQRTVSHLARVRTRVRYVGFVADKDAVGQVSSVYFGFLCQAFYRLLYTQHHPSTSYGAGAIGQ
jgi:hypothetical protein